MENIIKIKNECCINYIIILYHINHESVFLSNGHLLQAVLNEKFKL